MKEKGNKPQAITMNAAGRRYQGPFHRLRTVQFQIAKAKSCSCPIQELSEKVRPCQRFLGSSNLDLPTSEKSVQKSFQAPTFLASAAQIPRSSHKICKTRSYPVLTKYLLWIEINLIALCSFILVNKLTRSTSPSCSQVQRYLASTAVARRAKARADTTPKAGLHHKSLCMWLRRIHQVSTSASQRPLTKRMTSTSSEKHVPPMIRKVMPITRLNCIQSRNASILATSSD